jgi:ligand-binding sensor domain-containing protein
VFDNEGNYLTAYNEDNSSFQTDIGSPTNSRVGGLAFDDENNLWISNSRAENPISVLRNDGTWKNFALPCTSDNTTRNMAIDAFGYKWFAMMNTGLGILVFDEGDLNDDGDDRCIVITTSNSNLPTNEVRDLALDLDGNMWVGTKQGVIVFECNVLDNDCPGSLRIVDEDDFGAFLLEEEDVLSVAVDGANRKWFGTTNGIFVQSPSGEEKVANFTTANSPLFDNTIQDIAFDNVTGEVYIGTNEGLQVYRSDATAGGLIHDANVTVFPNPVRPEYTVQIAIKGLAEDADVKITDVTGLLVYETTALGGQAIWDGKDYTGRKANTGVYLVFSTSKTISNPNTAIAKILFIN